MCVRMRLMNIIYELMVVEPISVEYIFRILLIDNAYGVYTRLIRLFMKHCLLTSWLCKERLQFLNYVLIKYYDLED